MNNFFGKKWITCIILLQSTGEPRKLSPRFLYTRGLLLPVVGFCHFCTAFSSWKDRELSLEESWCERIPPVSKCGPWLSYWEKSTERPISSSHVSHGHDVLCPYFSDTTRHLNHLMPHRKWDHWVRGLWSDAAGKEKFFMRFSFQIHPINWTYAKVWLWAWTPPVI